jgi:translation elongation factor EF-G
VVSADDKNEPKQKLSRFPGGKEYPTFGNPLEGFPTKYKELLKKLQRSNDSSERHMLINKMNVIRKKLNLIPLTGGDNKKSDDKSADYPVGSLQYRLQKNNPKDAVKYDNQLKATTKDIADLTDNNDHNGAVMALAKMMGDKSSIAEMEKIQRYHELKGHMPQSLTKYRSSILNNLLVQAKKKYGDKVAKQLHSSF